MGDVNCRKKGQKRSSNNQKDDETFGDTEIKKRKFHYSKYAILMSNLDIDKIIVSEKISFGKNGFKYLNSYKKDNKVETLCVILLKISGYTGNYDNFDRR